LKKKPKTSAELELQRNLNQLKAKLKLQAKELKGESFDSSDLFHIGPPVSPKEFIESKDFYGNVITGEIYPWIIDTMEDVFSGEYHAPKYQTVVCSCGIGSGKGTLAAAFTAYMVYWLLSFKSLRRYLATKNITWADADTIAFMNMAPSKDQAKNIVFDRVKKFINRVKVFKDMGWKPDPNVSSQLQFKDKDQITGDYFNKLLVIPGNSSKTFTLGYSIFGGCIDESNFFIEKTKDPCKDIYEEMDGRRKSRFKHLGVTLLTSSANTEGTYTEGLAKQSQEDPNIYYIRKSMYDCKPEYFSSPRFKLKVQREKIDGSIETIELDPPLELKSDYERNRSKALRDYDAIPSVAGNPFFSDFALLSAKINTERKDPCPDLGMDKPETPFDVKTRLHPSFIGNAGANYRVHIDLAKGDVIKGLCGVGFAMAHKVHCGNNKFKIKIDLAVRFKAKRDEEININEILDLVQFLRNDRKF